MEDRQKQITRIHQHTAELERRLGEICGEMAELIFIMGPFIREYQQYVLPYHKDIVRVQRQVADIEVIRGNSKAEQPGEADTVLTRMVDTGGWRPVQEQFDRRWGGQTNSRLGQDRGELPEASAELKALYSEIVSKLHPGLARFPEEHRRRTHLMEQVDKDYVARNVISLRGVAEANRVRTMLPEVVSDELVTAMQNRSQQLEQLIVQTEGRLFELKHGDIARLWAQTQVAKERGTDLLAELHQKLREELAQVTRKLIELQR